MDQAGLFAISLAGWKVTDQPLSLDNVAAKAGYSKWHLQRMFKDVTGPPSVLYSRSPFIKISGRPAPDRPPDSRHCATVSF